MYIGPQFNIASQSDIAQIVEEAVVKLELCKMLAAVYGKNMPTDWSQPMGDVDTGTDDRLVWITHLTKINSLDPLANFNLGVSDAALGDHESALGHFIACAIVQPHDVEAWTNTIICAFQNNNAEMIVALLHLSISEAGLDSYDSLRANLIAQGIEDNLLAGLDKTAIAADARPNPNRSNDVIFRILDEEDAIVVLGGGP